MQVKNNQATTTRKKNKKKAPIVFKMLWITYLKITRLAVEEASTFPESAYSHAD